MKIFSIFGQKIYAVQHHNEQQNELARLMVAWIDPIYLYKFLKENEKDLDRNSIREIVNTITEDAYTLDKKLDSLSKASNPAFETFFKQLNNSEFQVTTLSKRKGRINYLRLYAIKIDNNCFIITGGAIKLTHLMKDRKHTNDELKKLEKCKQHLQGNGVFDIDSLKDFLNEQK